MKKKKINVLITGLGGGGNGMQVLKALKLSSLPYYFIGTDIEKLSFGLSLVDKGYVVPLASHEKYLCSLRNIIKKEKVRVLFPGSDPELKTISQNRLTFEKLKVLLPINPAPIISLCMDKYKTMQFLKSKKFNVPRSFFIKSLKDTRTVDVFPVVCKPHIASGGSNNVFIAQDRRELRLMAEYLLKYLRGFLVQEYVGSADCEYTVGVLADLQGNMIDSIVLKRNIFPALSSRIKIANRSGRAELGKILTISSGISQGRIGKFREIAKYCEQVAAAIGVRGPLNFQCRVFDGKVYIFEINPRFSGTTSLRAIAGFNEPDILIRKYVLGQRIKKTPYKKGVILRALEEKLIKEL
ncbi:MAG: ATP-grasp domain-containing protein [Candidatus Omnitrophica bacterium]|nr:ATP-grasp domain-containing protein [Candidatus Omnitrophota bacterium]